MAERTEMEKAQETFELKLKEQEMPLERQHKMEIERLDRHFHYVRSMFEDQKKELLTQNDGLLGALGRVHGENEALKKRVAELEPALAKGKEEVVRLQIELGKKVLAITNHIGEAG